MQGNIQRRVRAYLQHDARLHVAVEAVFLHLKLISACRQIWNRVGSISVGRDGANQTRAGLRHLHLCAGNRTTARVGHDSGCSGILDGLGPGTGAEKCTKQENHQIPSYSHFVPPDLSSLMTTHGEPTDIKTGRRLPPHVRSFCHLN